mmetsp:Transcript_8106/g.32395  ORF Transcript_8106/g.32395 Transcript_8106/m.32395 type:complete len:284 (+) Transcript_8106:117-968(+)
MRRTMRRTKSSDANATSRIAARASSRRLVALVDDGELDTLTLGQRNHRLAPGADREHVRRARRKLLTRGILQVHDFKASDVLFAALNHPDATGVAAARDHAQRTDVKLDEIGNLVRRDVNHDGVTLLDERIGVSNRASVVQADARHALIPELFALHLAQLVLRLDGFDAVHDESSLVIVNQSEVFIALFDAHDVHDPARVALIHANLPVHLHHALHENRRHFLVRQRVLQAVAKDEAQRQALARLVRTGRRFRGEDAAELVEHPVLGRIETLQMLAHSTGHVA